MEFKITYEVADGYIGGRRPQTVSLNTCDFDPDSTEFEIENAIADAIQEHYDTSIYPSYDPDALRELATAMKRQIEKESIEEE